MARLQVAWVLQASSMFAGALSSIDHAIIVILFYKVTFFPPLSHLRHLNANEGPNYWSVSLSRIMARTGSQAHISGLKLPSMMLNSSIRSKKSVTSIGAF
ncbi:hypothetical protein OG21DRAFT_1341390 [Imleria badia]|nr:hypothetical protein OG21DRAFT_1341390 [Imleria badia]